MHESSLIWKQDAMGRVRVTAARRAEVVAEFPRSGDPHPACWRQSSSENTAITCRITVRSRSGGHDIILIFPGKP